MVPLGKVFPAREMPFGIPVLGTVSVCQKEKVSNASGRASQMSTVRMLILAKMERARPKEIPARSKSGEERTHAPANNAQGSHDRRRGISPIASRSGRGRKIRSFVQAQEVFGEKDHATSPRCIRMSRSASIPLMPRSDAASMMSGQ